MTGWSAPIPELLFEPGSRATLLYESLYDNFDMGGQIWCFGAIFLSNCSIFSKFPIFENFSFFGFSHFFHSYEVFSAQKL